MNLKTLMLILAEQGIEKAKDCLNTAGAASPEDADLKALQLVLDREAAALAGWQREKEPVFALQQIRNRALACGLSSLAFEAAQQLNEMKQAWLAVIPPTEPEPPELVRTLPGSPGGTSSLLALDGRATLNRTTKQVELRDLETGHILATYVCGPGTIFPGPEGRLLITSGGRASFQIRDLVSGEVLFEASPKGPQKVQLSQDGRFLALGTGESSGFDGEYRSSFAVELWEVPSRRCLWKKEGSGERAGGLTALAISPNGRWVAAVGCAVLYLWNAEDGRVIGEWPSSAILPGDLAFFPDGHSLMVNNRNSIVLHDLKSGQIRTLEVQDGYLDTVSISPDGTRAVGIGSGWLRHWELTAGNESWNVKLASGLGMVAWFLGDSGLIAASPVRGRMEIVDQIDGRQLCHIDAHVESVQGAAVTSDGRYLVTADTREVKVWNFAALRLKQPPSTAALEAFDVLVSPNGHHAALVKRPLVRVVCLQDDDTVPVVMEGEWEIPGLSCVTVSPQGKGFLCGASDGAVTRISIADRGLAESCGMAPRRLEYLAWSPDGKKVAACFDGKRVLELWPAEPGPGMAGAEAPQRITFSRPAKDLNFSPDGRFLATAHEDGVRVLDTGDGGLVAMLRGWADRVALSADGFVLVARRHLGTTVWNLATGMKVGEGNFAGYYGAALSPDGRWALTETGSGTLTVEFRAPGQARLTKAGEIAGTVTGSSFEASGLGVVFAPDGEHVVTILGDSGLGFWHLATGNLIARIRGGRQFVRVAISQDGHRIIANDTRLQAHFLSLRGLPTRP